MLIQWLVSCQAKVEGMTPKDLQSNQAISNNYYATFHFLQKLSQQPADIVGKEKLFVPQ